MLEEIIDEIISANNNIEDKELKHLTLSTLWTKYYKLSSALNSVSKNANDIYMMTENDSYIIEQSPKYIRPNEEEVIIALNKLEQVIKDNSEELKKGILESEVNVILDWIVYNTRNNFKSLGINLETNSLNGYCELGQILSILPLEKLGLQVTKNKASCSLGYNQKHYFGTVTFPLLINNEILLKTYLIDTTYRQFFTTIRCNEGRYYTKDENTNNDAKPDPGYFVDNILFSKKLMLNGYVELNKLNAEYYGKPFYLSTLNKEDVKNYININFYDNIISDNINSYAISEEDLEQLNIDFPVSNLVEKSQTI